jgi:undecaprenyl phosphate N,N'-diacetylbacillosamine 1-phosphate transferase
MMYDKFFKRLIDILISLLLIIIAIPFLLVAAIGIKLSSPGPILFLQKRIGQKGNGFQIYKLRTMELDTGRKIGQTYTSDPAVFRFGKILRRLKIDELPQIFNVLRGDMSIVGPRPCLKETYVNMPKWARARFLVRPGITGLAQISGNVALTWEERWMHDVHYVEKLSLIVDFKIVIKTIAVVVAGEERFKVRL